MKKNLRRLLALLMALTLVIGTFHLPQVFANPPQYDVYIVDEESPYGLIEQHECGCADVVCLGPPPSFVTTRLGIEATQASAYTLMDRQQLAQEILNRYYARRILMPQWVSNMTHANGLSARENIRQAANGQRSRTPAGREDVYLSEHMLRGILYLNDHFGTLQITSLTGGNHGENSNHYDGRSVDMDIIGSYRPGQVPNSIRGSNWSVTTYLRSRGFRLNNYADGYWGLGWTFHLTFWGQDVVLPNTTITWNGNGGVVYPTTWSRAPGTAKGVLPVPTRSGFTFVGWYTMDTGTRLTESSIVPSSNVTYYARWQEIPIITWNPNGGTVNPTTWISNPSQVFGVLPVPTRSGYTFIGWFDTPAATGGSRPTPSMFMPRESRTFWARWIQNVTVYALK